MENSLSGAPPRGFRVAVGLGLGLAAAALLAHIGVAAAARHSLTQVEAIIAVQARMLAEGQGLYWGLDAYPYTVSPYGPIIYAASAGLQKLGATPLAAGRLLSVAALLTTLWLVWRLLGHWGLGELERRTGLAVAASAGVLGVWGVTGQSDMLALAFSVAALERYVCYEGGGRVGALAASGLCIALAIFTKQSFLAAGAAVTLALLLRQPRRGLAFAAAMAAAGGAAAWALNFWTGGGYWENAVLANMNPFAWVKLTAHLEYFARVSGALALVACSGFAARGAWNAPLHLYTGCSLAMWLLTAPKIGSDLNYQLEPTLALCLAAAWSIERLRLFELLARRDPGWVTLLQIPLLLHLVINAGVAAQSGLVRLARDGQAREQQRALEPWLAPERGRLLSVEIDPLLHADRPLEVEPLIYTLLVDAGAVDPDPVTRDLESGAFQTVILYQDLHHPTALDANPELPTLPATQLEIIRERYALRAHAPGPYRDGLFLYEPVADAGLRPNPSTTKASPRWSAVADRLYSADKR